MMEHPIGEMMQSTMASIKDMVDVNTVVGDPVVAATGATIIPVSKVCFGYVTGGGDLPCEEKNKLHPPLESSAFPFAGGSGAGVSVQPVGFLVVGDGTVKMLPAQTNGAMERVVELLPQLLEDLSQNGEQGEKKKARKVYKTEIETFDFSGEEEGAKS